MAGTLVKKVMLRIAADDGDTEQKLDKISAKADELARKHPDLKVKIDTAAASAKLAALRMELKRTDDEAKDSKLRFGALGGALNGLTLGIPRGVGEMSMFGKVMAGLNVATGIGEPLVAGLTVAVGGLSAGLVSAGAGLGVFGLVAKSVWSGVASNITAATAAENKMASARTLKQQTADAKQFAAALKGLNPGQKSLVIGAANAESGWHSFVQSAAGGVASVLVPALNLVPKALSEAKGFLGPVEGALRGVVGMVSKGLNSEGFGSFIKMLQQNAGPMITKLAVAIGHVGVGIGGILRAFMPMAQQMGSGLDSITAKFAKWGSTLSGHSGFASLMSMFKSETPLAISTLKNLAGAVKIVVSQMAGMSTVSNSKGLLQVLAPMSKFVLDVLKAHPALVNLVLYLKMASDAGGKLGKTFSGLSAGFKGISGAVGAVSDLSKGFSSASAAAADGASGFTQFGGKISTVLQKLGLMKAAQAEATVATEGETAAQGELDVAMDANPIGLIIIAVAALGVGMYELIKHVTPVRDFFKGLWRDMKAWFMDGVHFVESHWKQLAVILATVLLGPIAGVVVYVATHWKQIKDLTSKLVDDVRGILDWFGRLPGLFTGWFEDAANAVYSVTGKIISFVRGIPGKIISGLSHLGSMLFGLGESAMKSLLHGLSSVVGGIISTAENWGHDIANAIGHPFGIHFSEPSEASKMITAGRRIALGLGTGMDSGTGAVAASAARLAASAGISGRGTAGAGALQVEVIYPRTGNAYLDDLFQQLRFKVREVGGGGNDAAQRAWSHVTAT
jgi:hypothetical protein